MSYGTYAFAQYRLDSAKRTLTCRGTLVRLRAKSFSTLLYLIENRDRTVSKSELLAFAWQGTVVHEQAVFQSISEIRALLSPLAAIETFPGQGYRWNVDTSLCEETPVRGKRWASLAAAVSGLAVLLTFAINALDITVNFDTTSLNENALIVGVSDNSLDGSTIDEYFSTALTLVEEGDLDIATSYFNVILQEEPEHVGSKIELAHMYNNDGLEKEAFSLALDAYNLAQAKPGQTKHLLLDRALSSVLLSRLQLKREEFAESKRLAEEARNLAIELGNWRVFSEAMEQFGEISAALGETKLAIDHFRVAHQLSVTYCPPNAERLSVRLSELRPM